jgi:trehalose 6-phosphate phosphatase
MQNFKNIKAAIVDMDGVITKTATLHSKAWKEMFDSFLQKKETNFSPFDIKDDYIKYVDGKPRLDGIRSFLSSREIKLPEGSPTDDERKETVYGLGNRKNKIFMKILNERGVKVYEDTLEILKEWKSTGLKLAVITSSKNGRYIMETSGLLDMFEVMVDGIRSEELGLKGKPEPDIFLQACSELGVDISQAVVIEDAIAGVVAGRKGKFGLVVGVARSGEEEELSKAGAEIVVKKLTELKYLTEEFSGGRDVEELPDALDNIEEIRKLLGNKKPALFLDYDGTLTPIVSNPDDALLSDKAKRILKETAEKHIIAVISGRDRADVMSKVGLENIIYAGSHGFDISGPDNLQMQSEDGTDIIPDLDSAEEHLENELRHIKGVLVERKKYAIAVHYRNVDKEFVQEVKNAVYNELERQEKLKEGKGKKVLELKPDIDWHKGKAVKWLKEALGLRDDEYVSVYIGDDITDEDAFREIKDKGIGIMVGTHGSKTHALFSLKDTDEALEFLKKL